MGHDFCRASEVCRLAFEEASDATGLDLLAICRSNSPDLTATELAQPAILTTEIAMLRFFAAECGLWATHFGGHSLGEYTALAAAGVFDLGHAARLVRERGRQMQRAVAPGQGMMLALTGRDITALPLESCLGGLCVDIASINSPHQLVLSGLAADVSLAAARARSLAGASAIQEQSLAVSLPFHSRLMAVVESEFRRTLSTALLNWRLDRAAAVTSNRTGTFHTAKGAEIVDALTRQVSGQVRWLENARAIASINPSHVIEIGPTRALQGLLLQCGIRARSMTSPADQRMFAKILLE
jgi:[acyl-carrier-protein] S-malonyltransferase